MTDYFVAEFGVSRNWNMNLLKKNKSGNIPVIEIAEGTFRDNKIEEAILTEGMGYIGKDAFADCESLHQVVLPMTMKEIGDSAFENCSSLRSVCLPMMLERIGENVFKGTGLKTLKIPKSVYWTGDGVLSGCSELEQMAIPENMDTIPNRMFEECRKLKKVVLHENLNAIGDRAFFGCSSLDFLIIPDSVKSIGQDAFSNTDKQFIIQCSFGSYATENNHGNQGRSICTPAIRLLGTGTQTPEKNRQRWPFSSPLTGRPPTSKFSIFSPGRKSGKSQSVYHIALLGTIKNG